MLELKEKKFFEHRQSLLESNTDKLHELLENETITNIMAIYNFKEFLDEFTNFKNIIINLSAATDKYLTNLMTEIENGMMHLIDNTKLK
jgi:6-phosphogluconate dehydrogenase